MSFVLRDARLPGDQPLFESFIFALQVFEHAFEPDRRVDDAVGAEYFAILLKRVEECSGRIFVAEQEGKPVGWCVFLVEDAPLYVRESDRRQGYIAELYVSEAARGGGIGQALIKACETEARNRGLNHMMIGVHAQNSRAAGIYARSGYAPYSHALRKYL